MTKRAVALLVLVALAAVGGWYVTQDDEERWLVTGRVEDAKAASDACSGLDGVVSGSFSGTADGGDPMNTVELRVEDEDKREAIVACLEDAGAEVTVERTDPDATPSTFGNVGP